MVLTLLAMVISARSGSHRYFGLIERGFYLGMTAWLATVAVLLIKGSWQLRRGG